MVSKRTTASSGRVLEARSGRFAPRARSEASIASVSSCVASSDTPRSDRARDGAIDDLSEQRAQLGGPALKDEVIVVDDARIEKILDEAIEEHDVVRDPRNRMLDQGEDSWASASKHLERDRRERTS